AMNVRMFDCYTGFKWIAAVIRDNEDVLRYIGGGEESYGFLAETFARDKDAVSAVSLMAEACAWAKDKGMDFQAMLADIYLKYGYSHEVGISVVRPGKSGAEEIQAMMKNFRENPPKSLAGSPVEVIKDYATLDLTHVSDGKVEKMDFPTTSNVLQYFTADNSKVSVRPSGTEPKIKFYIEVKVPMAKVEDYSACGVEAEKKVAAIKKDLGID
ncbi:MAG: phospho-sugar mutase, partial [Duncaniella sp.]|nr:phospho-sugar mutase [Duncaniella sp.]